MYLMVLLLGILTANCKLVYFHSGQHDLFSEACGLGKYVTVKFLGFKKTLLTFSPFLSFSNKSGKCWGGVGIALVSYLLSGGGKELS